MAEAGPSAWEDDNFDVRFAFFSRTDMEIRLRILEGRRSRLQERLSRVQAQLDRTQQQVDRYAVELQRHGVESVEREVRWLSDLIDAERDGAHGASEREPQDSTAHPDESAAFQQSTRASARPSPHRPRLSRIRRESGARWVRYE